ncbi:MAG: chalcone isomerase family protein [Gammaproteobacteria bacterium]|nr:chalcone isomerase family protein [Gammaproteobacteria bacterium]MDH5629024.1 chalcone isomerase family protein [Gammaproteobacteria bacterium]
MKKIIKLLLLLFCTTIVASEQANYQETLDDIQKKSIYGQSSSLLGLGLVQRMNDDYYIAALYLGDTSAYSSVDDIAHLDLVRGMEYRFVSQRKTSARGFARKIMEAISINNDQDKIANQKAKLNRFLSFFKGNLTQGDRLTINYHPDFGTRVEMNGSVLGEIVNSRELYGMIVNTWVGPRPPSSHFKEGIAGYNEAKYALELQGRFMAYK